MAIRIINSLLIVACLIVTAALLRQKPPQVLVTAAAAVPVGHDEPTLEPDAAELAMRSTLPAIHVEHTSLNGALQELSRGAHFKIEVEGVDGDEIASKVDVAANTTLRDAISGMLNWMNGKNSKEKWAAVPMGDRIVITSQENLDSYMTTVVYNVRDLIDSEMQATRTSNDAGPTKAARDNAVHKLMLAVMDARSVGPGHHLYADCELMGLIIVTASKPDHDKMAAVLQNLREASRERAPSSREVK